jgi:hypothetical protein
LVLVGLVALVSLGIVMASQGEAVSDDAEPAPSPQVDESVAALGWTGDATDGTGLITPVKKGGGGPPSEECCDPALEPGVGGPLCFEGHTCCPGGWQCNNPDGTPACSKPGEVCPEGCASVGDACAVDSDCCFNKCKGGRCR